MPISLADIEALVAQFEKSDWRRIELVADGVELRLSKDGSGAAMSFPASAAPPAVVPSAVVPSAVGAAAPLPGDPPAGHVVTAPSLGTFYRAPRPGEPPFVAVGERVAVGQDLCLVEVMKLFTTVHSPVAGVVVAVHAADGDLVEFGQPLVSIDPDG
jgi:acetyl-CoA carboxylase biotin carboxyl carrier protein